MYDCRFGCWPLIQLGRFALLCGLLVGLGKSVGWADYLPPVNYSVPLPVTSVGHPSAPLGWSGWVYNPNAYNQYNGYVTVSQGQPMSWQIFWDPSMGGTYGGSLGGLPAAAIPSFPEIPVQGKGANNVSLYSYDAIVGWTNANWSSDGMDVSKVYATIDQQKWTTGGNTPIVDSTRLDHLWNIPSNTHFPAYMSGAVAESYPQAGSVLDQPFCPLWRYDDSFNQVANAQTSNIFNDTNFSGCYISPTSAQGSDPAYSDPAHIPYYPKGGTVFSSLFGLGKTFPVKPAKGESYWKVTDVYGWNPSFTTPYDSKYNNFGYVRWKPDGVNEWVQFNNQETAWTQNSSLQSTSPSPSWQPAGSLGSATDSIFSMTYDTPSEPFFYQVLADAQFVIELTDVPGTGTSPIFSWQETFYKDGALDPKIKPITVGITYWAGKFVRIPVPRPTPLPGTASPSASTPVTYDVPVAVYVNDTKPPTHLHSWVASGSLNPRSGHALSESSFTMDMVVVDNNPYGNGGYPAANTSPIGNPGGASSPPSGSTYTNNGTFQPSLSYNVQRAYYGQTLLNTAFAIPPMFSVESLSGQILYDEELLAWNTVTDPGVFQLSGVNGAFTLTGTTPGPKGSAPWGNGQNPAYSLALYQVSTNAFTEPLGVHFTASPQTLATPAWPSSSVSDHNRTRVPPVYTAWDPNIPRIDFAVTDGSGNPTPNFGTGGPGPANMPAGAPSYLENSTGGLTPATPLPCGTPYYNVISQYSPCNASVCPPQYLGRSILQGNIASTIRPNVALLVLDTKYNRTYCVNPQQQGIYGKDPLGTVAGRAPPPASALDFTYPITTDNSSIVLWSEINNFINTYPSSPGYPPGYASGTNIPGPDNTILEAILYGGKPGNTYEANELINFSQTTSPTTTHAYNDQIAITDPSNPNFFRPYDHLNDVCQGIWVDQNTRLVFLPISWGDSNPLTLMTVNSSPTTSGSVQCSITDAAVSPTPIANGGVPADSAGSFNYLFRSANCTNLDFPLPNAPECSVTMTATDPAGNSRELKVVFFVTSTNMNIQSIEEKRVTTQ